MPKTVYDDETKEKKKKHGGSHDDLGVHPERKEAEVDSLEKLYRSESASESHKTARTAESKKEAADVVAEHEGLYGGKSKRGGRRRIKLRGLLRNRKAWLAGGGIFSIIISMFAMFNFLNVFKLENYMENIDFNGFGRYSSIYRGRSDAYLRSYIAFRLADPSGDGDIERNSFVRAHMVESRNPFLSIYRTLRTSSFEADVFNKHGIFFTSQVDADGRISLARVTVNGGDISLITSRDVISGNLNENLNLLAQRVNVELFENDADARREIRRVVDENTHWARVIKRFNLRRSIMNVTGTRKWKFFAKTRGTINEIREKVYRELITAVTPNESFMQKSLLCIIGGSECPGGSDSKNPQVQEETLDTQNSPRSADGGDAGSEREALAQDINQVTKEATEEIVEEAAEKGVAEVSDTMMNTVVKKLSAALAQKFGVITAIIDAGVLLSDIDTAISSGTLSNMVKLSKTIQYIKIYTTYRIAADQIKSGENVDVEELGVMAETIGGAGDGDMSFVDNKPSNLTGDQIDQLCKNRESVEGRKSYQPQCPQDKVGGAGLAGSITHAWEVITAHIRPLLNILNTVAQGILGSVYRWFSSTFGTIVNWIAERFARMQLCSGDFIPGIDTSLDTPTDRDGNPIDPEVLEELGLDAFGNPINESATPGETGALEDDDSLEAAIYAAALENGGSTCIVDYQPVVYGWLMGKAMRGIISLLGGGAIASLTDPPARRTNQVATGAKTAAEASLRDNGAGLTTATADNYINQLIDQDNRERVASMSIFERYLSPDNHQSVVAQASNKIAGASFFTFVGSLAQKATQPVELLAQSGQKIFGSRANAAVSHAYITEFAGVEDYGFPADVMTSDPMRRTAPDCTNLDENSDFPVGDLTWDLVTNSTDFWARVYDTLPDEADAKKIYNICEFDQGIGNSLKSWFTDEDDAGLETADPVSNPDNAPTAPTTDGPVAGNTADVPCAAGSQDGGEAEGYRGGQRYTIRVCIVGGVDVNSTISANFVRLVNDARAAGLNFSGGGGFRTMQEQISLRRSHCGSSNYAIYQMPSSQCSPPTARPGYSNHQMGLAIDFPNCSTRSTACYQWLSRNAASYGLKNFPKEAWHWSVDGK